MKKLALDQQVLLGFGLAVLLMFGVGVVSYLTTERFIETSRQAVYNAEIVTPLERTLSLAYEVETAQRGFLFSDDPTYLEQRNRAVQDTRDTLADLRALTRGEPALLARVEKIAQIVDTRFALLDEVLRAVGQSTDQARDLLARGLGRQEMANLGREVNLLAAERHGLLKASAASARGYGDRVFIAFFAALALAAVALLILQQIIRREITSRQKAYADLAESQARQAQLVRELQSANDELSSFAYVASHDLKAPLRAIGSLAHWISSDHAEKFDEDGREQMALLLSRVKRMDRLIDGILQYSRVGRVKEARSRIDLNALLSETIDLLDPPAHIVVTVGPLPNLFIERARAQQLFQNLIGNAIQYMDKPEGRIHVQCRSTNGDWHFTVEDNGPGIEPRHWDRIFLMFQSLTPRDRTESTGIGLSLVKKIVEMHGGRIWIESKMHAGSTFHFTLPKAATGAP